MYDSSIKHGRADYNSWMQITDTQIQALTGIEGTDASALQDQRFAKLVYSINQPTISLTGQTLQTSPASYATIIQTIGAFTYVLKAAPGTAANIGAWQAQQIYTSGGMTTVKWADGNSNFAYVAEDYHLLNYI